MKLEIFNIIAKGFSGKFRNTAGFAATSRDALRLCRASECSRCCSWYLTRLRSILRTGSNAFGRWIFALFLAILFARTGWADATNQVFDQSQTKIVRTKIIDGFFLGVQNSHRDKITTTDDQLIMLPWNNVGPAWFLTPAEPEYAYEVEATGTNGVPVPKTDLGKRVGMKFFDFNVNFSTEGIKIKHLRAEKAGEATAAPLLFRPNDLFMFNKPGDYTLKIRFQILTFPKTGLGRRDYTNRLIRFPPIDYPVVKR